MKRQPTAFLSYSHTDRELAEKIATGLRAGGVETFFDQWDIQAGDSIIQRIFSEGLARADVFLVLLSVNSVQSRWVQTELDVAMIKRIEGTTRVIPLRADDSDVPEALRALSRVDLSVGFDEAMRKLLSDIYGLRGGPPVGEAPEFVKRSLRSVGGLSGFGTALGVRLMNSGKYDIGNEEEFTAEDLAAELGFEPTEINDAIEELERLGLVKTHNVLGTAPYNYKWVTPTYALFLHFKDAGMAYDPEEDIKAVANTIASQNRMIEGQTIRETTKLPPLRINRAVEYLDDYGIVKALKMVGTAPFSFGAVQATGATRRFVADNCR